MLNYYSERELFIVYGKDKMAYNFCNRIYPVLPDKPIHRGSMSIYCSNVLYRTASNNMVGI